jgi:hypothetical protein
MRFPGRLPGWLFVAAISTSGTPALAAGEAEWLVAPYLWYPDISLDQSAGDGGGISASDVSYRHAVLEYKETVEGETDTTTIELSGPLLGFVFRF